MEVTDLDNSKTVTKQSNFHIIKDASNRKVSKVNALIGLVDTKRHLITTPT